MRVLRGYTKGWATHPAVKMWGGHGGALIRYQRAIVDEWLGRGYRDTCWEKTLDAWHLTFGELEGPSAYTDPPWVGDESFHRAHQSNLIRKDPEHYGPLFPGVPDDLPYIWP